MPRKRFGAEQIIPKLREAEVDLAKGQTVVQVGKKIVVAKQASFPLADLTIVARLP